MCVCGVFVNLPRSQTEGSFTGKEVGRRALPTCPNFLEPCVQDLLMTCICPSSGSLPSHPVMSGLALLFLSLVIYLKCEEVSRMPSSLSCITDRGRFLGRELRSTSARLSVVAAEGMELFAQEHRVLSH